MTSKLDTIATALEKVTETKVLRSVFNQAANAEPRVFAISGPGNYGHLCAISEAIRANNGFMTPILTVDLRTDTEGAEGLQKRLTGKANAAVLLMNFETAAADKRQGLIDVLKSAQNDVFVETRLTGKELSALPEMKTVPYAAFDLQIATPKRFTQAGLGA